MESHILNTISYMHGSVEGVDNEKLANFCISEGVRMNINPLESRYEDFYIPSNEEWNKVFDNIQFQYMNVFKTRLKLMNHWSQVHKKYESTNKHNHVNDGCISNGPDVSGVYYVRIPRDAGRLVFEYNINQYQKSTYWVEPVVGNFLIFPSTLCHSVTKNLGDDLRISISFNAKINNSK